MSFGREQFDELKKKQLFRGKIVTGSMEPLIKVGDEIVVSVGEKNLKRFDIIVFYFEDKLICHYLWRMNKIVKPIVFQTRSMSGKYDVPLHEENYLGKVLNFKLGWWWKLKHLLK